MPLFDARFLFALAIDAHLGGGNRFQASLRDHFSTAFADAEGTGPHAIEGIFDVIQVFALAASQLKGLFAVHGLGGMIRQVISMAGQIASTLFGRKAHGIVFEIAQLLQQGFLLLIE